METPIGDTGIREAVAGPPETPAPAPAGPDSQRAVIGAVAAGGAIGACARYGAGLAWPVATGGFPWTTLLINALGCGAMGVLMVLLTRTVAPHPLLRPFLGTGILGGFTTFSTYTVDTQRLMTSGHAAAALTYLVLTAVTAVTAVWGATAATRLALGPRTAPEREAAR